MVMRSESAGVAEVGLMCMVMSMLPLYTHISSFSMIFNIRATFGSIIRLGQCFRMCFEPLAIYTMSFRPFPTIFNDFRCFYGISDVCSLISDLSLHRWTIYAFPILYYTYSMCYRPPPTLFRLYLSLEILIFRCFNYL